MELEKDDKSKDDFMTVSEYEKYIKKQKNRELLVSFGFFIYLIAFLIFMCIMSLITPKLIFQ